MQNVICGEFLSLGIMGLPNSRRRHLQVVFCSMELNVRSKQKPISAGISKGHPDASGVDDAKAADRAKTVLHLEKGVLLEREAAKMGAGLGAVGGVGVVR